MSILQLQKGMNDMEALQLFSVIIYSLSWCIKSILFPLQRTRYLDIGQWAVRSLRKVLSRRGGFVTFREEPYHGCHAAQPASFFYQLNAMPTFSRSESCSILMPYCTLTIALVSSRQVLEKGISPRKYTRKVSVILIFYGQREGTRNSGEDRCSENPWGVTLDQGWKSSMLRSF